MLRALRERLADRNRLPRWVNRGIDYIADHPRSLPGRLAASRYGRPLKGVTTPALELPAARIRLLIAPVNYSGQAHAWARAIEQQDASIRARNFAMAVPGGFTFDADLEVPVPVFHNDTDWQRRQFAAATHATHVLIEAEEAPIGRLMGRSVERQAEALMAAGVDVAFVAHGTDIRLPSRNLARAPWSHYRDSTVYTPRLEDLARRNRDLLDRLGRPVFVSTPDLLADVPYATWLPVVVDLQRWARPAGLSRAETARVAHAPSISRHKGSHLISPTLSRLGEAGVLDYRLITGIPSAKMPAAFHEAEIVLDQFRVGSYGVAACEAMASGCVVVGHVLDEVREVVLERTGLELPIVEATPDTLEGVLRELAGDTERLENLRQRGAQFVRSVHDGRLSATILIDSWLSPTTTPPSQGA